MNNYNNLYVLEGVESLKLNYSSRILLIKLISLKNGLDKITISQKDLQKLANAHKTTVFRSLKQLAILGYLTCEASGQTTEKGGRGFNTYTINMQFVYLQIKEREKYMNLERDFKVA